MPNQFTAPTVYFLQEGRENLQECLRIAFQAALEHKIGKLVIFTAKGEGVRIALDSFSGQPEYKHISLIAITFPAGKLFTGAEGTTTQVEIPPDELDHFRQHGVPIIKAHLPFDPIQPLYARGGALGQDLCLVGEALNMFCGSMSLCVEAIVLACDAGAIDIGEHVIALTSDTAILAQAASTRRMLEELVIREVLCKPAVLTVTKRESVPEQAAAPAEIPAQTNSTKS